MATLEQIIEEARALSPEERRCLRDALDRDLQAQQPAYNPRTSEMRWIEEHRDEYTGQWVVVEGDALIAHGTNAREVFAAARAAGISAPFLVRVEEHVAAYIGGWQ